jgi:hypothetical protein
MFVDLLLFGCLLLLALHCLLSALPVVTPAWHLFIRVDVTNEAVYELVAEPVQEPQEGKQQEDAVKHAPEEATNPADLQGKPRSMSLILITPCYTLSIVHLRSRN